jgi:AAA+ ATPase superfamily predicted ATPase
MAKVKRFIVDCLSPLWMLFFFRLSTIRREVKQINHRQRLKLIIQCVLLAFSFTLIVSLMAVLFAMPLGYTESRIWAALCLALSIALGAGLSIIFAEEIGLGIVSGIMVGVTTAIGFSTAFGVACGIVVGIACGIAFITGSLRVPFLLLELPTTLWALTSVKRNPQQAARYLRRSLAYWDELMRLPHPLLARLLVTVGQCDKVAARNAITHLVANTFQRRAAETALLELSSGELLSYRTTDEIGKLAPASFWLSASVNENNEKRERSTTDAFTRCQKIAADIQSGVSATSNYNKLAAFDRARRQLEEVRQFAVIVLRGRESQTFARIAQQWLDVVNAEIGRLTEKERAAEKIPNPYIAPNPLVAGTETFVGRSAIFRSVEEHFLRSAESAPMVLFGQPRIGKTSLLRNLGERLPTNLIPIYVDMQRSALVGSTEQLLANLAKVIRQGLAERGIRVKQPAAGDFAAEPFSVFDNFLDEVEEAIRPPAQCEAHRIILALDEFEVIEQKLTEGKVSRDLMPYLRSMMQHRRGISLLFAGTHTLDEMIGELWIPYFRSAVPHRVSYLDEASARKLITNPIADFPLNYSPEAVDRLIAETRCHPCLIQLTCSALVDLKNQRKSHHAAVEDVEQALSEVLKLSGRYVFEGIWEWVPKEERNLLMIAAASEAMMIPQAARALAMPESRVSGIVERLIEAEVLLRAEGRAEFRLQVPLFRRWVARQAARAGIEWGELRRMAG